MSEDDGFGALLRAVKSAKTMQTEAASLGFDWDNTDEVIAKLQEECIELAEAVANGSLQDIADEFGDILFSVINLSRHLPVTMESSLALTNKKFDQRFSRVKLLAEERGINMYEASLEQLEQLWQQAKRELR